MYVSQKNNVDVLISGYRTMRYFLLCLMCINMLIYLLSLEQSMNTNSHGRARAHTHTHMHTHIQTHRPHVLIARGGEYRVNEKV